MTVNVPDDEVVVNGTTIVPAGDVFQGDSVPVGPNDRNGGLWDIEGFDVTSLLAPGPNTLRLTTGVGGDCLSLVVATVDLPAGAAPPTTDLSVDDVTLTEGNSGTKDFAFTVTRSGPTDVTSTVDVATANNTAAAPDDYTARSETLTFAPGDTSETFTVSVNGDTAVELDETFFVNLTNPTGASVLDGQGVGTIANDDEAEETNLTVVAAAADPTGGAPGDPVTVSWTTRNTATRSSLPRRGPTPSTSRPMRLSASAATSVSGSSTASATSPAALSTPAWVTSSYRAWRPATTSCSSAPTTATHTRSRARTTTFAPSRSPS